MPPIPWSYSDPRAKYGNRAMTGAEVRWGFNLDITGADYRDWLYQRCGEGHL